MSYSQNDERWKNDHLGTSSYWTMGAAGCYVTAASNALVGFGHDINPGDLNRLATANGLINSEGDVTRDDWLQILFPDVCQFIQRINWNTDPADLSFFDVRNDLNTEVIVMIDTSPAAGMQTHFMRTVGWDGGNDVLVDDSWDGARRSVNAYASRWGNRTAKDIIYVGVKYIKVQPPAAPAPAPAPVSVPEPVAAPPLFTIEPISPLQLSVLPNRNKWNLAYPDKQNVVANPITNSGDNTSFTAVAMLRYNGPGLEGANYYLDEANTPHGWNVVDCVPYKAPAPLPTGAVPITSPVYEHVIVKQIPGYETMTDAQKRVNPVDVVSPGVVYYLRTSKGGMDQLATSPNGANGVWINPSLNVPDPTPEQAQTTTLEDIQKQWNNTPVTPTTPPVPTVADNSWKKMTPFVNAKGERTIREFKVNEPYQVTDLEGRTSSTVSLKLGEVMKIAGYFKKDGLKYYRPKQAADNGRWWGIPFVDKHGMEVIVESKPLPFFFQDPDFIQTPVKRVALAKELARGKAIVDDLESEVKKGYKNIIDGIFRPKRR